MHNSDATTQANSSNGQKGTETAPELKVLDGRKNPEQFHNINPFLADNAKDTFCNVSQGLAFLQDIDIFRDQILGSNNPDQAAFSTPGGMGFYFVIECMRRAIEVQSEILLDGRGRES